MHWLLPIIKRIAQSRVGLALLGVVFLIALAAQWNGPQSVAVADEIAYITGGIKLISTGEYTNPFGQPELWFPPVYPVLIGCLSLGGKLDGFLIARLISAVASIGTLLLVYQLVGQVLQRSVSQDGSTESPLASKPLERLPQKPKVGSSYGFLATLLLASNPTFQHYATRALSESLATFLSVAALSVWVRSGRSIRTACAVGGLIGLAALTRPECILVLPLWMAFEVFRFRDMFSFKRAVLAGVTTGALLLPYAVFLHEYTGKWSISNKGPVNLAAGRSAFHESPREFIDPDALTMGFFNYDTSISTESRRYLFNVSKLIDAFSEIYFRDLVGLAVAVLMFVGWRYLWRMKRDLPSGDTGDVDEIPLQHKLAWGAIAQTAYLVVVCVFDVGGPKNLHLMLPMICMLVAASIRWTIHQRQWMWIIPSTLCLTVCVAEGATRYPRWTLTSTLLQEQLLVDAGLSLAQQAQQGVVYENGASVGFYANLRRGRLTPNTLETITSYVRKHENESVFLSVTTFNSKKLDPSVRALLEDAGTQTEWQQVVRIENGRDAVAVFRLRPDTQAQVKRSQAPSNDTPSNDI